MSVLDYTSYIDFLKAELESRLQKNSHGDTEAQRKKNLGIIGQELKTKMHITILKNVCYTLSPISSLCLRDSV